MKRIYKYTILTVETQIISIPGNQILSATTQGNNVVIYAIVDDCSPIEEEYEFKLLMTGDDIDINLNSFRFLDTVKIRDNTTILHVFYKLL